MDFNELCGFYERIAGTRKRLEITDILAELFIKVQTEKNFEDLPKIIYLTQGRLVSEIDDWPKFGIAEKMIIQALVKFTGTPAPKIKELVDSKGDIGECAEELLQKREKSKVAYSLDAFTKKSSPSEKKEGVKRLEIRQLYGDLKKLSDIKGDGSQDQKIALINGILRTCTPQAAKYVLNIIISNLRIGLADMTIMDSLAVAFLGSKDQRIIIEEKYNIHPDLGEIANIVAKEGLTGLQRIQIQVGIPIRMMLASRIPYMQIHAKMGGKSFIAEYKYDGERVQVHKNQKNVVLYSRQLKAITEQYPDVVAAIQKNIQADSAILEGEIVAMDPFFEKMLPFQVVSTRRRKYDIEKMVKEVPVRLHCFDLLYLNQYSAIQNEENSVIMNKPLPERRSLLEKILKPSDPLVLATQRLLNSNEEMIAFFNEARAKGAEGIMNKSLAADSVYKAGNRGFQWIKLKGLEGGAKMMDTIDVVIIGGSWGMGRRKGMLSTLFGAVFNEDTSTYEFLTRIGSGFSDEDLQKHTELLKSLEIKKLPKDVLCKDTADIWVQPKLVLEIMGDELTVSNKSDAGATLENPNGYSLRFPIFQRIRDDKDPTQITTTQEVIDLYQAQDGII
jgi:DNA ligase-1